MTKYWTEKINQPSGHTVCFRTYIIPIFQHVLAVKLLFTYIDDIRIIHILQPGRCLPTYQCDHMVEENFLQFNVKSSIIQNSLKYC